MIPARAAILSSDVLRPSLAINFLAEQLDSRISFSRPGSVSTRWNPSGFIEAVGANLPRFDYDPVTLAARGLLIEEQRTNSALQSNNFSAWTLRNGHTVVTDQAVSPDGTTNADRINVVGGSGQGVWADVVGSNGTWANSVYVRAGAGLTSLVIQVKNRQSDTIVAQTSITPPADWTRLSAVGTTAGVNAGVRLEFFGIGTGHFFACFAQAEVGSFPTSYIPTTSAQVTRTEDIPLVTGLSLPAAYSIYVSFRTATLASPPNFPGALRIDDGTSPNRIGVYSDAGGTDSMGVFSRIAGVANLQMSPLGTLTVGTRQKIAARLQTNNGAASHNGAAVVTDLTGGLPAVNQMRIGAGDAQWNGWIEEVRIYPTPLTDAQLQAITA